MSWPGSPTGRRHRPCALGRLPRDLGLARRLRLLGDPSVALDEVVDKPVERSHRIALPSRASAAALSWRPAALSAWARSDGRGSPDRRRDVAVLRFAEALQARQRGIGDAARRRSAAMSRSRAATAASSGTTVLTCARVAGSGAVRTGRAVTAGRVTTTGGSVAGGAVAGGSAVDDRSARRSAAGLSSRSRYDRRRLAARRHRDNRRGLGRRARRRHADQRIGRRRRRRARRDRAGRRRSAFARHPGTERDREQDDGRGADRDAATARRDDVGGAGATGGANASSMCGRTTGGDAGGGPTGARGASSPSCSRKAAIDEVRCSGRTAQRAVDRCRKRAL